VALAPSRCVPRLHGRRRLSHLRDGTTPTTQTVIDTTDTPCTPPGGIGSDGGSNGNDGSTAVVACGQVGSGCDSTVCNGNGARCTTKYGGNHASV
jgi:hypothetical protein